MLSNPSKTWLALIIGNSRLHWGLFNQNNLLEAWNTNYLTESKIKVLAENKNLEQTLSHLSTPSPPLPLSSSLP
ncbi:Baf family transcriptional activator [Calothrix parasitica NIES-267]|uniref:Baf family transcriptional activator n=1 Tax=Calothrix parasitica NIES-267 TaxID=1973488 RepID=A0A1Z4LWE9_9CYAN|nr:Baf family transcriptional activator [Calothrix parasitica NIES-267]